METPINDLELSVRAFNTLKAMKIHTIEQLLYMNIDDLPKINKHIRPATTEEIKQAVKDYKERKCLTIDPVIYNEHLDRTIDKLKTILDYQLQIIENNKLIFKK